MVPSGNSIQSIATPGICCLCQPVSVVPSKSMILAAAAGSANAQVPSGLVIQLQPEAADDPPAPVEPPVAMAILPPVPVGEAPPEPTDPPAGDPPEPTDPPKPTAPPDWPVSVPPEPVEPIKPPDPGTVDPPEPTIEPPVPGDPVDPPVDMAWPLLPPVEESAVAAVVQPAAAMPKANAVVSICPAKSIQS